MSLSGAAAAGAGHGRPYRGLIVLKNGGLLATAAYLLWGFFPLYFLELLPSGPWEIVAWRVLLSLAFCVPLVIVTRSWRGILGALRQPSILGWTAAAALLIFVNWQIFVIANLTGRVIEISLGYFLNPSVVALLAVVVIRERLRPAQWAALGAASVAVGIFVVGYGELPWVALSLASSFGFYGLVKKKVGAHIDALGGLVIETAWLTPVALVQLACVATTTGITMGRVGSGHTALLLCAGIVTTLPLLLFAAAVRTTALSVVGLLQFISPMIQFAIGAWLLGEPMPLFRWVAFGIVWFAFVIVVTDSIAHSRAN